MEWAFELQTEPKVVGFGVISKRYYGLERFHSSEIIRWYRGPFVPIVFWDEWAFLFAFSSYHAFKFRRNYLCQLSFLVFSRVERLHLETI